VHKGMILNSGIAMRQAIANSGDTALIGTFEKLNDIKLLLGKLYTNNATKEKTEPYEKQAEVLEKELTRKAQNLPEFKTLTELQNADYKSVQSALSEGEMAIEYASFKYRDDKNWTDSTYYCALILRKEYEYPKMIYLCEERELQKVLTETVEDQKNINELYATRGIIVFKPSKKTDPKKLDSLIWKPIENELKGIKRVCLSPSGLLHKVSFAALPIGDSLCLSDKYEVNIVSTTANVLKKSTITKPSNVVLYGGIEYNTDTVAMAQNAQTYQKPENALYASRSFSERSNEESWQYLVGTKAEAEKISSLFKTKKVKTTLFQGQAANEESFKALAKNNPDVLHIATHGFYFEERKLTAEELNKEAFATNTNIHKSSKNPLMRSGIIMSGANNAWNGKSLPANVEDGILTGYEISQTNLRKVKLGVLSACQTGLGEIKSGEGIFGLQRALKMAGVEYLIVSLWSIPDKETVEFMELFYKKWLKNKEINQAFREAQTTMRKKYPPYYWAAFKLVN